jgi:hypothetical protein
MTLYHQIKRMERIDKLINLRATGTPAELANKLGISLSQLFQVIKTMKEDFKAPVYYSRSEQCYRYPGNIKFVCKFTEVENVA